MISIIVAIAANRAIGHNNKLLYWLPNDLKRFKALTTGHTIIMGRRTFESLPKGALPNRRNVVVSRTVTELPGCDVYPSLEEAIASCQQTADGQPKEVTAAQPDNEIFIIGGASIYEQALPLADRLCLTLIHDTPSEADAFFPDYTQSATWRETFREDHDTDEKHHQRYSFVNLEK